MTIGIEDRRRRRGGVLVVLAGAIVAAWLVYLWLDGIRGDRGLAVDSATTTMAGPTTTTTSPPAATTTTLAATTTTTTIPLGEIESAIVDIRRLELEQFGTRFGEPDRFAALFEAPGEPAFGLTRVANGSVLYLARLSNQGDLDRLDAACTIGVSPRCESTTETTADVDAPWIDGVVGSFVELGDVRFLGLGVVGGEYTLLGQVGSEETKARVGAAVATAIAPDLTLVNELEVLDSDVITGSTEAAIEDLDLQGITFESGSADITPDGQAVLDEVIAILTAEIGVRVEVGGHTDNAGGAASNQRLSQARAESVVASLVDGGVDESILTAVGYGEEQPIADNATAEGREQNRRIEFTVSPA